MHRLRPGAPGRQRHLTSSFWLKGASAAYTLLPFWGLLGGWKMQTWWEGGQVRGAEGAGRGFVRCLL